MPRRGLFSNKSSSFDRHFMSYNINTRFDFVDPRLQQISAETFEQNLMKCFSLNKLVFFQVFLVFKFFSQLMTFLEETSPIGCHSKQLGCCCFQELVNFREEVANFEREKAEELKRIEKHSLEETAKLK